MNRTMPDHLLKLNLCRASIIRVFCERCTFPGNNCRSLHPLIKTKVANEDIRIAISGKRCGLVQGMGLIFE